MGFELVDPVICLSGFKCSSLSAAQTIDYGGQGDWGNWQAS